VIMAARSVEYVKAQIVVLAGEDIVKRCDGAAVGHTLGFR